MAVVNTKATAIANADSVPVVINNANLAGGNPRFHKGVVSVLTTDSVASVYRFARVHSSDMIDAITLRNTALGGTCAADVGVYQTAQNGGSVVDADFFASAVSLAAASAVPVDVTHESGVYTVAQREMPLWQALGLSADPQRDYDLALTSTVVASANGSVACQATVQSNE